MSICCAPSQPTKIPMTWVHTIYTIINYLQTSALLFRNECGRGEWFRYWYQTSSTTKTEEAVPNFETASFNM